MFLLVPAYPGCPGSKAVKRSLLLGLYCILLSRVLIYKIDVALQLTKLLLKKLLLLLLFFFRTDFTDSADCLAIPLSISVFTL